MFFLSGLSDRTDWLERSLQSQQLLSICKFSIRIFRLNIWPLRTRVLFIWRFANELNSDLSSNNLTGTIPDLALLNNLNQLYLNKNRLTGTIPSFPNSLLYVWVFSYFSVLFILFLRFRFRVRFSWFSISAAFSRSTRSLDRSLQFQFFAGCKSLCGVVRFLANFLFVLIHAAISTTINLMAPPLIPAPIWAICEFVGVWICVSVFAGSVFSVFLIFSRWHCARYLGNNKLSGTIPQTYSSAPNLIFL